MDKKGIAILLAGKPKDDEEKEEGGDEAMDDCCQEMFDAVKEDDFDSFKDAFKSAIEIYGSRE